MLFSCVACVVLAGVPLAPLPPAQHHGVMYHYPQWSADGRWILASSTLDGDAEIVLISTHGEPIKQLTRNTATDDAARWIDGGRRILFETDRRGRSERFVMNADGSDPRPADAKDIAADAVVKGSLELREDHGVIQLVDRRTGRATPVTRGLWAEQASFNPQGDRIVYEQRSTSNPHAVELSNVVVARLDGTEARIVSPGTDPSWSPDGQRLLFKIWDSTRQQLFIASARPDGHGAERLAMGVHPQWSPDGRRIVFMQDDAAGTHIWVMEANGTGQQCLTCASSR